jgi:CheY-like chemotaxis protein
VPRAPADPEGGGETILVVDDEPAVLAVTARILRQHGYRTLEAASFEEALAIAADHDFQLLLTDSVMPKMSGATLAERVTELVPGLAVLYMSGYSQAAPGRIAPAPTGRPASRSRSPARPCSRPSTRR